MMRKKRKNRKNSEIWSFNDKHEILNECLHRNIKKRYQADSPFENPWVPYALMILCALVDGVVFYSMFSKISYDSPVLMVMQMAGFLFGFDIVPIFLGIWYKKYRQGLVEKGKMVAILALLSTVAAFGLNVALRLFNIDIISPSAGAVTNYMGTDAAAGKDYTALSTALFGIFMPAVTSLGSFFISFHTSHPLRDRERKLAEMVEDTRDEVRRLDAILADYDAEPDFAENLFSEDQAKFNETLMTHKALVSGYCDYVRERLKEHLGNPTSNNVLSKEISGELFARLDRELALMNEWTPDGADPDEEALKQNLPANRRKISA